MRSQLLSIVFILFSTVAFAQSGPTTGEELQATFDQLKELRSSSVLKEYPVRNVGPVVMGGRITDLAVNPEDLNEYYVAYASGGLFHTTNNGVTFKPIFDNQGALGIGDIALAPTNPDILFVGTGENNSSRSSYAGNGVYKSTDGGSTWTHSGLGDSHHIGRIIIHPQNPDIVWVASQGALYTHNDGRGVYKSTNGGQSWNKTLYINDSTGIIDLLINPQNPDQLWATAWERTRRAWNFKENGPGSGIYVSTDGGETWQKSQDGFMNNEFIGRVGIDLCQTQPNIMYAFVDNQTETKEEVEEEDDGSLKRKDFINMTSSQFLALDNKKLGDYLKNNNYPSKYNAGLVKKEVREGKYQPRALADYFGDANTALFNTKITGAELYRSEDFGKTWGKVNSYALDGVYFTYGYYFGEVRVAPDDPDLVYIFGVPFLKSRDGGKTVHRADTNQRVHGDHHALWINPDDSDHMILGNDGGLYVTHDAAANWNHINNTSVGQFYTVNVDMEKPYNVYGGLQDNGTLAGSSRSVPNRSRYWDFLFGGDGMYVAPDPRNSKNVIVGFQFGNYFRIDRNTNRRTRITPRHDIGEDKLRFNWRSPVVRSTHNPDIIYFGANRLFRSLNQGDSWEAVSPDLTTNYKPQGNVPFSTLTSISESPLSFGLIIIGTDDGNVQITRSSGGSWELATGLPKDLWVSSVQASPHDEATFFVSLNGYRDDDFRTYVYKSTDYGKSWTSVKGDLPEDVVNIILQDPVNPDLLYVGQDHATFISMDGGSNWHMLTDIPNVASYDMVVHPRDNELVVATHGRSIYIADVKPLQKITRNKINEPVIAFDGGSIRHSERWGQSFYPYLKPNEPKAKFMYYVGSPSAGVQVEIYDEAGTLLRKLEGKGTAGIHHITWDLKKMNYGKRKRGDDNIPKYVGKGKYQVKFINGSGTSTAKYEVR